MSVLDNDNVVIVPCDFTPLAYMALEHGACMAKVMKQRLLLLHVVTDDAKVPAMEKKLSFVAEESFDKFGIRPEVLVKAGSRPYAMINRATRELNPSFVVLKTGGVRGIKHYTGIRTIKILSGTHTPFLVVQAPLRDAVLHNIVFPINFLNQHDAKLRRVVFFSQYFPEAVMHIITPSGKGTGKEKNIAGNLELMTKVLVDQGVKANFITHDKKKNTAADILELSKSVDADMIMVQMENVPTFSKFLFGLREEKLITNPCKIPVVCINRLSDFKGLA